jgi:dienelactone hydrolase
MHTAISLGVLVLVASLAQTLAAPKTDQDPLAPILKPHLKTTVDVMVDSYRNQREYADEAFPLSAAEFDRFRNRVTGRFVETLGMEDWRVQHPQETETPLAGRFVDRQLETIEHHGIRMEVHVIEIPETGLRVPAVLCLPAGSGRRPGVCVFSGHSRHGLRDLVLDLESYQSGIAVRLAKEGFVTIAVEKIDTGYLSRDGKSGVDENPVTTFGLYWGKLTRAHQLMACVAASEVLAAHPRVDAAKIGATGVSLGGWLSVQTALLSDRIKAVADFGVKTVTVPPGMRADAFKGMVDLCHILPGMLSICDRNLMSLAYAPRPLLAGHGRRDAGSQAQGPVHYRDIYEKQYAALGFTDRYEYHVHDGGDTMPVDVTINYFRRQFESE